MNLFINILSV